MDFVFLVFDFEKFHEKKFVWANVYCSKLSLLVIEHSLLLPLLID